MITSRHFSQLASLMELSSEAPACKFRFISQTYGLGFAEQVRGCVYDQISVQATGIMKRHRAFKPNSNNRIHLTQ